MKNKEENTGGNVQKGGINPKCYSLRPSEPPKGQGSQRRSDLILMHRRDVCAECSHATFFRGFDADGLRTSLVACAGGGYKAIAKYNILLDPSSRYVDCQNRRER
jgi:hypothetical protein